MSEPTVAERVARIKVLARTEKLWGVNYLDEFGEIAQDRANVVTVEFIFANNERVRIPKEDVPRETRFSLLGSREIS